MVRFHRSICFVLFLMSASVSNDVLDASDVLDAFEQLQGSFNIVDINETKNIVING
jgi:hypothetical protein